MKSPDINGGLRLFNQWWDDFILELIKPAAILSMGLGTVAIFNLQGLAIAPWYVLLWAIVQAISIDGLFFATWDRLFSQKLRRANILAIIGLSFIGLILALVAIAINAVLGFQVLWAIADSQEAMARLGISSSLFTIIRAILAVAIFIMMAYVRSRARATTESTVATKTRAVHSPKKATVAIVEAEPVAIPLVATSIANGHSPEFHKIMEAWLRHSQQGEKINMKAIADEAGVGYSTVKKHAPKIKQELGI